MASKTTVTCDLCEEDITHGPKFYSEMGLYHKKTDDITVSISLKITMTDHEVEHLCKQCYEKLGIPSL